MRQGFIKVAALTPKVTVADTKTNREEICRLMDEAEQKGAKILVFPELCITGYTCGDLFYQQVLLREAKKAAQERHIAVLSSLHDLNQALAFGDRFFFLKDGAIRCAVTRDAVTEDMLRDVFGPELRLAEVDGEKVVLHRRAV